MNQAPNQAPNQARRVAPEAGARSADESCELRAPRYTSYPSALAFSPAVGAEEWIAAALRSNAEARPLSLYLHLPFCASACFYCGCHRVISSSRKRMDAYLDSLGREIELQAPLFHPGRRVAQIHLGGGTPNHYPAVKLAGLLSKLARHFRLTGSDQLEVALEADPRLVTMDEVRAWRQAGFNRVSFGVQDISLATQRAINRVQSAEQIAQLTQAARDWAFRSVNYDLVYGLPLQSADSMERTLDFVLQQRPDRIAAFHYAHLPQRFRAQRAIVQADLPDLDTRLALRGQIASRLQAAGYLAIGLDHYALPQDALAQALVQGRLNRNFQGYTPLTEVDIVGLGASSIGFVGGVYAQNDRDLARYQARIAAGELAQVRGYALNDEDRLRADAIRDLMCGRGLSYRRLEQRHGAGIAQRLADALPRLAALDPQGQWLRVHADGVEVLPAGRERLRLIASAYDAHLDPMSRARLSQAA